MGNERTEETYRHAPRRNSGAGMGLLAVVVAMLFIIGPFVAPVDIPGMSQVILVGFGVLLLLVGSGVVVITRLYKKTAANEAFVKTGMGGRKAIVDGGGIVVPVVHNVVWVSLETMKLEVARLGKDALLTADKLRADIRAEFFIRVDKKPESVLQAATSLGDRCSDPAAVKQLIEAKLVSALRVVAATMTLEDLNKNREQFAVEVQKMVAKDIEHNGYMLETVTISHLDQAPPSALDPENNVFDAEGSRRIAEITSKAKVERNLLHVDAEKRVKEQDVARDQFLYEQEITRARSEAEKGRQIAEAEAEATASAAKVAADQSRQAQVAEVVRDRDIAVANVEKQKQLEVANQDRERTVKTAEIARLQATEVAEREKQIAIADAERRRAEAESQRLAAEKLKETEAQAVTTVTVTATAERNARQAVIAKQAEADQTRIAREIEANVTAYAVTKSAEAEQNAAEAKASARLRQAKAEKEARVMEAEGETAVQMVPVNVSAKQVEVEQARVVVLTSELRAKTENAAIASELEKALASITADKEARIAMAEALGKALAAAKMTIWGDPSALARVQESFYRGQTNGHYIEGLVASTPSEVKDAALAGVAGIGTLGAALIKRLTGIDVDPTVVERTIKEETTAAGK